MEEDSEEEAHEHALACTTTCLYALGIKQGCSNKTVKKFRSLEDISMEQRRKDAGEPLYLFRYK
jgi:hypothetical protein